MTLDLQPSFGLAASVGSILASVAVWAFFWWLSGHAKTGLRRPIRVVLVLAGVLYVAFFLYTFLGPIDTGARTRSAPSLTPSSSVASLSPGELPLPTPPFVSNPPDICAGVGVSALLRGDAHDPALTWVEDTTTHTRRDVVWPVGYRARFAPRLEVLDASGTVVLREGDLISGTCGSTADGRFYLAPPFR
jgi:hypothetical protein